MQVENGSDPVNSGQKAASRTQGANALRAEGWAFVHSRGRYTNVADVREAFGLFIDEVGSIARAAAEVDEAGPEGPPPIGPSPSLCPTTPFRGPIRCIDPHADG